MPYEAVAIYILGFSIAAVIMSCYDKAISRKRGKRRVPEATMLTVAFFGGSVAMLLSMLTIRHKTKHPKFMVGLPLIMVVQLVLLVLAHIYLFK